MSKHSSGSSAFKKPNKPHRDFPLTPNGNGQWSKKIRGKVHYFGKWSDPQAALAKWIEQKDDLLAGRTPRKNDGQLDLAALCNHFLTFKKAAKDCGELAVRTFDRYFKTCEMLIEHFGKRSTVESLRPEDFQELRGKMAKRWGAIALANEIQIVRSIFRFGFEGGLIEKPVRFGPYFAKPSAKTLRATRTSGGPKMFSAAQIRAILHVSTVNMKAMVLLGINCALGNTDLALLRYDAFDLQNGWLDYARAKTAIPRRIPLWKETVEALEAVAVARISPTDPGDACLVFIGPRGENYVGNHRGFRVHQESKRVFSKANVRGRTFYDLRRTFQTIAEGARDLAAVQSIMGHAPGNGDMSSIYRQRVDDLRLKSVTEYVRAWLIDGESVDRELLSHP